MKTIAQWLEILNDCSTFTGLPASVVLHQVREEALNEAERIARRDEHAETADKIAALKNVP